MLAEKYAALSVVSLARPVHLAEIPRSILFTMAVLLLAPTGLAQENIRLSLASAEAAEARRKAAATLGYYNVKLGPTAWRFGSSLGVQYNTNIRLAADAIESFVFIPSASAQMRWPVSDQNSIDLKFSGGYYAYVSDPDYNRWFVHPGSELSFDFYVGDFWVNFHDRFRITTDNYQDPTVVGTADYSQLENDLGVAALWDMNKLLVRFGYDHINYLVLSGDTRRPDAQNEVFSTAAGYAFRPGAELGVELGAGLMNYDTPSLEQIYTDGFQWSAGAFLSGQITEYIEGRLSGGYTMFLPDDDELDDFSGLYVLFSLSHRLNEHVAYTLAGGRTIQFALYGGTIDMFNTQLAVNWHVFNKITLTTSFLYEHGEYLVAYIETFDRYGPSLAVGRSITEKLSGSLTYQFYDRDSTVAARDYNVHIVGLNLYYRF